MEFHYLKLPFGSCSSVIKHDNGHISVVDLSDQEIGESMGVCEYLARFFPGESRIARFIMTNPAAQDFSGFCKLWESYRFHNFWHNNILPPEPTSDNCDYRLYRDFLLGRMNQLCNVVSVGAGYRTSLCSLEVLSPSHSLAQNCSNNLNDAALVLLCTTAHADKILYVGDIGARAWREMLADDGASKKLDKIDIIFLHQHMPDWESLNLVLPLLKARMVICGGDFPSDVLSGTKVISTTQSGSVMVEDQPKALSVYVSNENRYGIHPGLDNVHPRNGALRFCTLSHQKEFNHD